jgi:hypothetical protein
VHPLLLGACFAPHNLDIGLMSHETQVAHMHFCGQCSDDSVRAGTILEAFLVHISDRALTVRVWRESLQEETIANLNIVFFFVLAEQFVSEGTDMRYFGLFFA